MFRFSNSIGSGRLVRKYQTRTTLVYDECVTSKRPVASAPVATAVTMEACVCRCSPFRLKYLVVMKWNSRTPFADNQFL